MLLRVIVLASLLHLNSATGQSLTIVFFMESGDVLKYHLRVCFSHLCGFTFECYFWSLLSIPKMSVNLISTKNALAKSLQKTFKLQKEIETCVNSTLKWVAEQFYYRGAPLRLLRPGASKALFNRAITDSIASEIKCFLLRLSERSKRGINNLRS